MRFSFTRLSLLKFFILNKKHTKKTLLIINFAIFLTIFALSSALISVYTEDKINQKELDLIETQRNQNYFHKMRTMFPVFHKSLDTALAFDRTVNRFNLVLYETKFGNKIMSNRELYFYRFHALIGPAYDLFEEDLGIEDLTIIIDWYFEEEQQKTLGHEKIIEKYYYFKKKYKEIKKDTEDFEQYQFVSKTDLLKDTASNESSMSFEKYIDYWNIAWELNLWFLDLLELMEKTYVQAIEIQKIQIKELNDDIIELSKRESRFILFAFFLQLIIFIIIQFFEISSVRSDNSLRKVIK